MAAPSVDPITLTVIWNAVLSIAEELGICLRHTAFSEGVREGDVFSTAVFDASGRMIAQGPFSPGHLGSFPYVVRAVLDYFPASKLKPEKRQSAWIPSPRPGPPGKASVATRCGPV